MNKKKDQIKEESKSIECLKYASQFTDAVFDDGDGGPNKKKRGKNDALDRERVLDTVKNVSITHSSDRKVKMSPKIEPNQTKSLERQ